MKQKNQREDKKNVNGVEPGNGDLSIQQQIALRAYDLYLERGGINGHEVEDWLQAEREILAEECQ